jgi:hypothetical protein
VGLADGETTEDEATTRTAVVAPNIKSVYAQRGVIGDYIAGADEEGNPDYSGAIGKIATKPSTGMLWGAAHVSPSAKPIKFTPPDPGDRFVVYTAAPGP